MKCLQEVQKTAASFILGRYDSTEDIATIETQTVAAKVHINTRTHQRNGK
jgi:hypothetical protein